MRAAAALAGLACLAGPLTAHPHIFVDAALRLEIDATGRMTAIEVTWGYDPFSSLLVFEDRALDQDYDGQLTEAERARLKGFDLVWEEAFAGGTFVEDAGQPVDLLSPEALSLEVEDGFITTRHLRRLAEPALAETLSLRVFDPTYYTAFTLLGGVVLSGPGAKGCVAEVMPPDLDRAYTLVEELLYSMPSDQIEAAYPAVGEAFASTVTLRCDEQGA